MANTRAAFVSTYPPRRCGIATFTYDLSSASGGREIVALMAPGRGAVHALEVHHQIRRDEQDDYVRVARSLTRCADVVSIQHEYGIWGGEDGAYVLDFVQALSVPATATLHTVLRNPTVAPADDPDRAGQQRLGDDRHVQAAATISGERLRRRPPAPRGHPPRRARPSAGRIRPPSSRQSGSSGATVILSFGLLGPGKGLRARRSTPCRRSSQAQPGSHLRHRRRDPSGPCASGRGGLPASRWRLGSRRFG